MGRWCDLFSDGELFLMNESICETSFKTNLGVEELRKALTSVSASGAGKYTIAPQGKEKPVVVPINDWKPITVPWNEGGDDKQCLCYRKGNDFKIIADCDCDADGSPNVKTIDPGNGQLTTSLSSDGGWKGTGAVVDGTTYVDSEKIPYFVLPLKFKEVTGVTPKLGDIAKITWKGKSVYAIYADEGPADLIGEGSIKLIEALGGNPWNSSHTKVVSGLPHGVEYLVKTGTASLSQCHDFDTIQGYGASVFGDTPVKKVLSIGSQGDDVLKLQQELNTHNAAGLTEDGNFGPKTEAAVKDAQRLLGLEVTGMADGDFINMLQALSPKPRPSGSTKGAKLLRIPWAKRVDSINTSGNYVNNYPKGLVIHWTSGSDAQSSLDYLREQGYPCLVLAKDGTLMQPFDLSRWGWHTGTSHSKTHVGLEIDCAGGMTDIGNGKYKAWFGRIDTADKVRHGEKKEHYRAGWYEKYTEEQEHQTLQLCLWLKWNNPDVFDFKEIKGHDQCCDEEGQAGRKIDPGWSFSMLMSEFISLLEQKWEFLKDAAEFYIP